MRKPAHIRVRVITVGALFGGDYRLRLPWFQRAYAWQEEHALRMLSDAHSVFADPEARPYYHFGRLRLASREDVVDALIIDGQQRTITLTILLALLRDLTSEAVADRLQSLIAAAGGSDAGFIVAPQPAMAQFFIDHVQRPGATRAHPDDDVMNYSESERHVLDNRDRLAKELADYREAGVDLDALATFLIDNCTVDILEVDDEQEGWALFETRERTGLAFHVGDRLKITLLSVVPRNEQDETARLWETAQGLLGVDGLLDLMQHLRTIHHAGRRRKRSNNPIEADLQRDFELNQPGRCIRFLGETVLPAACHAVTIRRHEIGPPADRAEIADRLEMIEWIEERDWVAPLLQWLDRNGDRDPGSLTFVRGLDRLVWVQRIVGVDARQRESRMARVLAEVRRGTPAAELAALRLDRKAIAAARSNLTAHTFYAKKYRDLVLRRLSRRLGADPGSIRRPEVTIEHVLPRNPPTGRDWWRHFRTKKEVDRWVNCLGNLALLPERINQLVDTRDFGEKRPWLLESEFLLSRQAAATAETDWTPKVIERRTAELAAMLLQDLGIAA